MFACMISVGYLTIVKEQALTGMFSSTTNTEGVFCGGATLCKASA